MYDRRLQLQLMHSSLYESCAHKVLYTESMSRTLQLAIYHVEHDITRNNSQAV